MRSLVIGDSGGIGAALRNRLAAQGEVIGLSRSRDGLEITSEESVAQALGALSGEFQMVFIATGQLGQPEKSLLQLSSESLLAQFSVNAIGPALVLKHLSRLLPRAEPCHVGVLSARVGSIGDNGLGGWYSYRTSKAALNQLVHTAAVELKRKHPHGVMACLHPGTVDTEFTAGYTRDKIAPNVVAQMLIDVLSGLSAAQSGGFFDYQGKRVMW
ncbi:C factor, cell signaling protein [Thioclava sp. SK-1]|uniref:SDR family NAD(P)-dependent oxidoreductase n=1 Tax=Thioclava sp. SK-1 TaxID=1889770 RepID=UPI0008259CBA|nr:SDR family NAD(P)-dependent oxidoreductase [Thioclava sp. SK-1]OCX66727.1 C factor, cell signaling protein [Thioclava sp. SK-1]